MANGMINGMIQKATVGVLFGKNRNFVIGLQQMEVLVEQFELHDRVLAHVAGGAHEQRLIDVAAAGVHGEPRFGFGAAFVGAAGAEDDPVSGVAGGFDGLNDSFNWGVFPDARPVERGSGAVRGEGTVDVDHDGAVAVAGWHVEDGPVAGARVVVGDG